MTKDKEPTSVYLRTDHKNWMEEENINRSELINELIDEYRNGPRQSEKAAKEYRKQQLQVDLEKAKSTVETKERQLERLEEELNTVEREKKQNQEEVIEKAVDYFTPSSWLSYKPKEDQLPEAHHDNLQYFAEQAGMEPETFREIVVEQILLEDEQ